MELLYAVHVLSISLHDNNMLGGGGGGGVLAAPDVCGTPQLHLPGPLILEGCGPAVKVKGHIDVTLTSFYDDIYNYIYINIYISNIYYIYIYIYTYMYIR